MYTHEGRRCKKIKINDDYCCIHQKVYEKYGNSKNKIKPKETCTICLDNISIKCKLECKHSYCKECIYKWICKQRINFTCPLCRNTISNDKLKNDACKYGLQNKLLSTIYVTIFTTEYLSDEEFNKIHIYICEYFNNPVDKAGFSLLYYSIPVEIIHIYKKILSTGIKTERFIQIIEDLPPPPKELYYFF